MLIANDNCVAIDEKISKLISGEKKLNLIRLTVDTLQ